MRISDWSSDVCSSDLHAVASARAMPAAKETESGSPGRSHATSNPNAAKSTGKEDEQTAIWRPNGIGESVLAACWTSGLPCRGAASLSATPNLFERPDANNNRAPAYASNIDGKAFFELLVK